jgi:hypothetical protein
MKWRGEKDKWLKDREEEFSRSWSQRKAADIVNK